MKIFRWFIILAANLIKNTEEQEVCGGIVTLTPDANSHVISYEVEPEDKHLCEWIIYGQSGFNVRIDGIFSVEEFLILSDGKGCLYSPGNKHSGMTFPVPGPTLYICVSCTDNSGYYYIIEGDVSDTDYINLNISLDDNAECIHDVCFEEYIMDRFSFPVTFAYPRISKFYPDNQFCSWNFSSYDNQVEGYRIETKFFEVEENNDYLYVSYGSNTIKISETTQVVDVPKSYFNLNFHSNDANSLEGFVLEISVLVSSAIGEQCISSVQCGPYAACIANVCTDVRDSAGITITRVAHGETCYLSEQCPHNEYCNELYKCSCSSYTHNYIPEQGCVFECGRTIYISEETDIIVQNNYLHGDPYEDCVIEIEAETSSFDIFVEKLEISNDVIMIENDDTCSYTIGRKHINKTLIIPGSRIIISDILGMAADYEYFFYDLPVAMDVAYSLIISPSSKIAMCLNTECGGNVFIPGNDIVTLIYPAAYKYYRDNEDCFWMFSTDHGGFVIEINFLELEMGHDYIIISNQDCECSINRVDATPHTLHVPGSSMTVNFRSDGAVVREGFVLTISNMQDIKPCSCEDL